ncbi:NTF2-like protein [Cutaneotrichosporon oleaginosum]|uniref:NTF2-like protein n=1 Tax=Cutaneotrichosporon oleaginosum TaxID=879819 RepID=A0A0J0XUK0_9TREE|nr:NTF2-like protein [Cutaneotrichosporon oleaginosum]KLT44727.1 NTF2-like protein [Cutaneotrichosporon oleaginosum]TXT07713.1 hypothetical protein COLE_04637 [Cutaneotrichosporon oleaginosum]
MPELGVIPPVARSLAQWHRMIDANDLSDLESMVHPDAVFRSPMAHTPYVSRPAVVLIINSVLKVFKDFVYYRTLASADGKSVVLEFSATVNGKKLKGIDLITFNDEGLITEFEVMVRPFSALQELGGEMSKLVKDKIPQYKGKL